MSFPTKCDFNDAINRLSVIGTKNFISQNFNWLRDNNHHIYTLIIERIDILHLNSNDLMDLKLCLSLFFACFKNVSRVSSSAIEALRTDLAFLSATEQAEFEQAIKFEEDHREDSLFNKREINRKKVLKDTDEFIQCNFSDMFRLFNTYVSLKYITVYDCAIDIAKVFISAIIYEENKRGVTAQLTEIFGQGKSGH
ncbi:MAG: hypothetical protein Q8P20_10990 [bacterium]|nr:hypothetical protein [bacterium]